jgi:toxin CcdB
MAKYDVCALVSGSGLVLDVQADILEPLNTRIVVPLMPLESAPKPARRLNPVFDIDGARLVMATQFASAVRTGELGKPVASLEPRFEEITAALDMLFQGF